MLCPKSVLITGANRGVGLEFVKQLSALDSPPQHIFATCRNVEQAYELKHLVKEGNKTRVHVLKLDVSKEDDIKNTISQVTEVVGEDGLSLLINNAAYLETLGLGDVTMASMMQHFQINVVGPMMLSQAAVPLLKMAAYKSNSQPMSCSKAAIINIGSKVASCGGSLKPDFLGGRYPYRSTKAALNMVTCTLAGDLRKDGILAAVLHPGWVQTKMGGSGATLHVSQSVTGLLKVMAGMTEKHSPSFTDFNGEVIPW